MPDSPNCATNPECFPDLTAHELVKKHGSQRAAAKAEGIPRSTLQDMLAREARRGDIGGPPIPPIGRPPEGFAVYRNSAAYDADGALLRQWVGTKPDAGEVYAIPSGHTVKGESALVDPTGRVLAKWIKTREGAGDGLVEGLKAAFAEYEGRAPVIEAPAVKENDLLTVYPIPDLHLGMLAWKKETGHEDYDLKIATEMAIASLETLVSQSQPSTHAVLLGLGDYYHVDDHKAQTPGSGHSLDVDGRWQKVFAAGAKLATAMVDIVARKHEMLEVRWLSGNHDINSAMCLTVALSLFYSRSTRITVNTDPGIAWYRRFGQCLLGGTHGHTMKPERMAMAMASDRAADWGVTKHRHIFSGHIHTETVREIAGVRVESLQALAARDAWNAASGYRSGRSMSAITFHAEHGEMGRHRVNIGARRAAA